MTHAAAPGSRLTFAVASATSGALAHSQGCMDGPLARDQRSVTPQEVRERTASCCRLRRRHLDACHRGWVFRLERPLLPGHGGAQRLAVYGAGRGLSTTRGAACGGQSRPIHSRCLPCSRDRHVAGAVSRRNLRLLDPSRDPHQRGRRTRQVVDLDLDKTWIQGQQNEESQRVLPGAACRQTLRSVRPDPGPACGLDRASWLCWSAVQAAVGLQELTVDPAPGVGAQE